MKCKRFDFNGAEILVLQDGEWVTFYMNDITSNYYFCTDFKAKIENITKRDAIRIGKEYMDSVAESDIVLRGYYLQKSKRANSCKRFQRTLRKITL